MSDERCTCWDEPGTPYCPVCSKLGSPSELDATTGSAALVREQDAANELYQAACTLMRYKEAAQWNNLENAAHRFNAARQGRINDEIMRQNDQALRPLADSDAERKGKHGTT